METVSCAVMAGHYLDRGFLHLPFCTIYGVCIVGIHGLIGSPGSGGLLLKKVENRALRYLLFTLLAMAIPTAAELVTGVTFEAVFGIRLWDYRWHTYDFCGYISLEMSLVWGIAVWLLMSIVYPRVERLMTRIPKKTACITAAALSAAVAIDWLICIISA